MGKQWATGLLLLTATFFVGCDITATDQRRPMPEWWSQIERIDGINLPTLETHSRFLDFVRHDSFQENIQAMGWNTYRLPFEWDDYVLSNEAGQGLADLDPRKLATAHEHLQQLVEQLHRARTDARTGQPKATVLIIDFHQYKFGAACGGVGIPHGAIDESSISSQDPNCIFKAFHKFWTTHSAKQGWYEFAAAILSATATITQAHSNWLHIAIEPINEPQFGFTRSIFTNDGPTTLWNLYHFTRSQTVQNQIDQQLIPFYRGFVEHMAPHADIHALLTRSLMVFEPFLLDHLNISVELGPIALEVKTDGHYHGMQNLWSLPQGQGRTINLHWIAAPHHYVGAMDDGFLSMMPAFARTQLSRYPNLFVDTQRITDRFRWMQGRMAEGGMNMIIGEWGTQAGLRDSRGRPGGYRKWIADSKAAITAHSLGGLWWQYLQDTTPREENFSLLHGKNPDGSAIPWHVQVLKCHEPKPLARLVFGRCP
jgi:hypothetical protein